MKTILATLLSLAVWTGGESRAAEPVAAPLTDLVVRVGPTTLHIRLVATFDGRPWREQFDEAQSRQVRTLFDQLDGDRDGGLSLVEAKRLPKPQALMPGLSEGEVHVAFNFRVLDANRDSKVSLMELSGYLASFVGRPVTTVFADGPRNRGRGELFELLDANRDGSLSDEEAGRSPALWDRDRDGNHVLATDELQRPQAAAYGQEFVARPLEKRIEGLDIKAAAAGGASPDVTISFDLSDALWSGDDEASAVRIVFTSSEAAALLSSVRATRDTVSFVIDRRLIEFRLVPPSLRRDVDLQRAILRQFDAAADPESGTISKAADLPMPLKNLFAVADRNGDGKLERPELLECATQFVAAQLTAESARLRLTVHPERRDLVALVDGNLDGRVSRREMARLTTALFQGPAGAQQVRRDEIPSVTRIVLQRGPFAKEESTDTLPDAGPPWFFRADRNHDGDLDRGEFLGDSQLFERLDRNADGWLDLHEAIHADRQFQDARSEVRP